MTARHFITILLLNLVTIFNWAQTTIVLHPDSESGKDAIISCYEADRNFGNHPDFIASAWTKDGNTLNVRSLMEFDLSIIPKKTTILSAKLSLYSYNSLSNGSHSTLGGSNKCYLQKITSVWDESMVTWNNQPTISAKNIAIIPSSENSIQHYTNIDITDMIQDMVDNPSANFGFMLKLEKEERYRKMLFASSDHKDPDIHPSLTITYASQQSTKNTIQIENLALTDAQKELIMKSPDGKYWKGLLTNKGKLKFTQINFTDDLETNKKDKNPVSIFFNYTDNYMTIRILNDKLKKVYCKIFNANGILIKQVKVRNNRLQLIDISQLNGEEYEVKVYDLAENLITQAIMKKNNQ